MSPTQDKVANSVKTGRVAKPTSQKGSSVKEPTIKNSVSGPRFRFHKTADGEMRCYQLAGTDQPSSHSVTITNSRGNTETLRLANGSKWAKSHPSKTPAKSTFINTRFKICRTAKGQLRCYRLADADQPSDHDRVFVDAYGKMQYVRIAQNSKYSRFSRTIRLKLTDPVAGITESISQLDLGPTDAAEVDLPHVKA